MQKKNYIIIFIISIFIVYSFCYIYNSRYIVDGKTYFTLLDDAMVSMRYADNMVNGYGPVFNPGQEAVLGYSNPLWMLIMAAGQLFIHNKQYTSLFIQILAVFILSFNLIFVYKIAYILSEKSNKAAGLASILTALYLPINAWCLLGMETSALILIVSLTSYLIILNSKSGKFNLSVLIAPAIGILVRQDMSVFFLVSLLFIYFNTKNLKFLLSGIIIFFLVNTVVFSFNFYFYKDILPNTYYLKMEGVSITTRILRGLYVFAKFLYYLNPLLIIITSYSIFKIYFSKKKSIPKKKSLGDSCIRRNDNIKFLELNSIKYIICAIFSLSAYSIYTGGDAWEWWHESNRFITPVMPLFFVLLSISIKFIINKLRHRFIFFKKHYNITFFVISILLIFNINFFFGFESISELFLLRQPVFMNDNKINLELALFSNKLLKHDATAAVAIAGVLPYFSKNKVIDILGKNDKYISKLSGRKLNSVLNFVPGHNKWDYAYSIGKLQPDAVLGLWKNMDEALPYLSKNYILISYCPVNIYIKKDSPNIFFKK